MASVITKKQPPQGATKEEREKILRFFKSMEGKDIFPEKQKKAEENLKKAKLI